MFACFAIDERSREERIEMKKRRILGRMMMRRGKGKITEVGRRKKKN